MPTWPTPLAIAAVVALAAGLGASAKAQAQGAFPDVPPCHWAAEAVHRIGTPVEADAAEARSSRELAANAPRQVLEGLRCQDAGWSARFLIGAPDGWPPPVTVRSFRLEALELRRADDEAELDLSVSVTLDDGSTLERSGTVDLAFGGDTWRVTYASLAELDLPLFP